MEKTKPNLSGVGEPRITRSEASCREACLLWWRFVVDEEVIKALEEIEYLEDSQEHIANAKTTGNANQTETCLRLTQIASSHWRSCRTGENPSINQNRLLACGKIGQNVGIKDCCLKRYLLTVASKGLVCKKWTFGCVDLFYRSATAWWKPLSSFNIVPAVLWSASPPVYVWCML